MEKMTFQKCRVNYCNLVKSRKVLMESLKQVNQRLSQKRVLRLYRKEGEEEVEEVLVEINTT